jgi:hypothetical protein
MRVSWESCWWKDQESARRGLLNAQKGAARHAESLPNPRFPTLPANPITDSANKSPHSFQQDTRILPMQPQNAVLEVGQWRGPMGCAPKVNTHMPSTDQLVANLANAQHSTGPKTEKGKHRTRLNAYRHGLTGQICLLTADEHEAFDQHCAGIRESLEPVGALEIDLAQSIAEDRWRLKRARALETGIFALSQLGELGRLPASDRDDPAQVPIDEALSKARTWVAKSEHFQLLALYEQRIHRTIEKNMAELLTLRAECKPLVNRRSTNPNCLPCLHIPRAKSTIRPATSRPNFCKLGLIFRAPA